MSHGNCHEDENRLERLEREIEEIERIVREILRIVRELADEDDCNR
jgi:archaellum component FlaC